MKDYLLEVFNNNKNGLYLIEQTTGTGKTFNCTRASLEYVLNNDEKKILYATTLNKNVNDTMAEFKKRLAMKKCLIN